MSGGGSGVDGSFFRSGLGPGGTFGRRATGEVREGDDREG